MRLSNGMGSFLFALVSSGLVACTADVRQGSGEDVSKGALEGEGEGKGSQAIPKGEDPEGGETPSGCIEGTVESAACEDPGVLKDQAYAICVAEGLLFTAFDYQGGDCGWQTTQAHYECCAEPPPPPEPPHTDPPPPNPPPPPEPPPICASGSIGDGVTCQPGDMLKLAAYEACEQAGLQLFDLVGDVGDCSPGEALELTYSCTGPDGVCP
ncbi:hypothetical protein [Polyangium sp. 6x1]|uniref:hypothetical protein n=1 Tax=Polyangium sp. 6x1 TaxID=3042689 RepID=UPI0024821B27|nr:hypothetical protein [Polyangium sp. 6x1]MDI1451344.1 hypothetical protein [Polyangium sp. 6x1]